jgi:hypothetical protein
MPLKIFFNAIRPFPFPSIFYKAYIELLIILYIIIPPTPSKFLLFSFVIEITIISLDKSFILSRL